MSKPSSTSTSSGETKQDDVPLHHLGKYMIPTVNTEEEINATDNGLWTLIFSFLRFNEYNRLRSLCHLFRAVLVGPVPVCDISHTQTILRWTV